MFRSGQEPVRYYCGPADGAGVECAFFVGASFRVEVRLPRELAEFSVVSSYDTVGGLIYSASDTGNDFESIDGRRG